MTHAGLASFCHVLICRDEDLVMKAAAAYEYLGIGTRILYYGANNALKNDLGDAARPSAP
jgi:hypothetical protein